MFIELTIERGANDRHIRVCIVHSCYADWCGDDAEKTNALRAGAFE